MASPLNDYRTERELGNQRRRKFGRVFLLKHRETNAQAVLKLTSKESVKPEVIALMRQEARIPAGNLHFPHTFYVEENEAQLLTLQEYIPGKNLDEYLANIPLKNRRKLLRDFLPKFEKAVNALHEAGWLHCDLKPSNILIGEAEDDAVHLVDLSLIHRRIDPLPRPVLYTLGYSSPELILHQDALLGPASDYFSAGIVIYRILTGQLPLVHANPAITTNLQLAHPLPEHERLRKRELELLRALTYKPAFPTAPVSMGRDRQATYLQEAIAKRMTLSAFTEAWLNLPRKRGIGNWFS